MAAVASVQPVQAPSSRLAAPHHRPRAQRVRFASTILLACSPWLRNQDLCPPAPAPLRNEPLSAPSSSRVRHPQPYIPRITPANSQPPCPPSPALSPRVLPAVARIHLRLRCRHSSNLSATRPGLHVADPQLRVHGSRPDSMNHDRHGHDGDSTATHGPVQVLSCACCGILVGMQQRPVQSSTSREIAPAWRSG